MPTTKPMTEKQYDRFARTNQPVGKLAKLHPRLCRGVVHRLDDGSYLGVFMGTFEVLEAGTEIELWNGEKLAA